MKDQVKRVQALSLEMKMQMNTEMLVVFAVAVLVEEPPPEETVGESGFKQATRI